MDTLVVTHPPQHPRLDQDARKRSNMCATSMVWWALFVIVRLLALIILLVDYILLHLLL